MSSKSIIRRPSFAEIEAFYNLRLSHHACEVDGEIVAMGTLTRAGDRLWGFFTVKDAPTPAQSRAVLYALMRGLRRINEPVYITTNEGVHERAIRLVRTLGFVTTGEIRNGQQVWLFNHYDRVQREEAA